MNRQYLNDSVTTSEENSYHDYEDEDEEYDKINTIDDIVEKVKSDILSGKIINIGFMARYYENFQVELVKFCVDPIMNKLLKPIIENGDVGGDIIFQLDSNSSSKDIKVSIVLINEFIGEHHPIIYTSIDIDFFNIFCDLVKDIAMFMVGDRLLTSI